VIRAGISVISGSYWPKMIDDLVLRAGNETNMDLHVGLARILLVLEATHCAIGLPITIIAVPF